jgi:hypothetical protein
MPKKNQFVSYTQRFAPLQMRRPQTAIPAQLKGIIQSEGKTAHIKTCIENIEKAKKNELNAYLSLCHARLNLPSGST